MPTSSQTALVAQAVANATKELTVTGTQHACPSAQSSDTSTCASHVPEKIKNLIREDKFVDMSLLLPNSSPADEELVLTLGENGEMKFRPKQKSQSINSFETWSKAFSTFVAIYCGKYPKYAAPLMQYWSSVRDMANIGANWRQYDEKFRQSRALKKIQWDKIDTELWTRCTTALRMFAPQKSKNTASATPTGATYQYLFVPKEYCFAFHRGRDCPAPPNQCKYSHTCFICKVGTHPANKCHARSNTSQDPKATQDSKAKAGDAN